ncbi:MAG: DMT family transporter [Clostridia bacterium]|nr:DMT family transporter [Clostridia bacterium]
MRKQFTSTILPLIAAVIWGTAFVAQDVCAGNVPPLAFNAIRFAVAVVFLALVKIIISTIRKKSKMTLSAVKQKSCNRSLLTAGLLCGLALAVASFFQQAGMEAGTDAGKSGFITALYVVLVPVIGLFFKKRTPWVLWIALAVAVIGLYLLCVNGGFKLESGDMLTLVCALAFAIQILLIDKFAGELDPILFCIVEFATAAALSFIGMLIMERPDASQIIKYALPILYVAVFSCGIAYLMQIIAQRDGDPTLVSLLFSMESVFSVISGAIILKQKMSARELTGCALILAAVVIAQLSVVSKQKETGI